MKTKVNLILGSLVGALCIWLAFRGTDFEGVKSSFETANYFYLTPVVLFNHHNTGIEILSLGRYSGTHGKD